MERHRTNFLEEREKNKKPKVEEQKRKQFGSKLPEEMKESMLEYLASKRRKYVFSEAKGKEV